MSKSNALETQLLEKVFNNTNFPWDANTTLYVSLHTADPGEAGTQTSNEAAYTGYTRVGVSRSGTGWTVGGDTATNFAALQFPQCTAGTEAISHVGIGIQATGAGVLLYSGSLVAALNVSNGIIPTFAAGALDIVEE